HYVDDILLASENEQLSALEQCAVTNLETFGLVIAPEKVQKQMLWKYLGLIITNTQIVPQLVTLDIEVKTVTDVQKLVGAIGWIRSYLGITNHQLQPLFELLSGTISSTDKRCLTVTAEKTTAEIELAL
ncbi:hypothetical protein Nmel_010890, partial [Mimus melanotis]